MLTKSLAQSRWKDKKKNMKFIGNLLFLQLYPYASPPKIGYKNTLPVFTSRVSIGLFTCKDLPALSAVLLHAPVPEEVHP